MERQLEDNRDKFKAEFRKRLYSFTLQVIEFIDRLPHDNVSRRIGDQLLRSGTSIIGNYTEGQAAASRKDFTSYFTISLKSCNESALWFSLLRDSKRATDKDVKLLMRELDEITKIFAASILTLKGRK
jgi:four helix bundle protein